MAGEERRRLATDRLGVAPVGPLPLRAGLGHRPRGLQRPTATAWELLPARPRPLPGLPLERGRPGRHLRRPADGSASRLPSGTAGPDPQGADLRARPARRATTARTPRSTGGTSTPRPPTPGCAGATTTRRPRSRTSELVAVNGGRGRDEPEYELLDTGDLRRGPVLARSPSTTPRRPDDSASASRSPTAARTTATAARAAHAVVPQHLGVGLPGWTDVPPIHGRRRARSWPSTTILGRLRAGRRAATPDAAVLRQRDQRRAACGARRTARRYPKDGISDHVVHGAADASTRNGRGTKAALHYVLDASPPGETGRDPAAALGAPRYAAAVGRRPLDGARDGRAASRGRRLLRAS